MILQKLIAKIVFEHGQFDADAPLAHLADNALLLQTPLILRSVVAPFAQAPRYIRKLAGAIIFQHSDQKTHISFRQLANPLLNHH